MRSETDVADFRGALESVLTSLSESIKSERRKSEPWAEMFEASRGGLRGALSEANNKIERVLLDLFDAVKERGLLNPDVESRNAFFEELHFLPAICRAARRDISAVEGYTCEADKMRQAAYLHYEKFLKPESSEQ